MPRPKKPESEKAKPREIHASDGVWSALQIKAKAADLSVSRYLIHIANHATPPANLTPVIQLVEELHGIQRALLRIADGLADADDMTTIGAGLRLVAIERQMALLVDWMPP